ncbi:MAG: hypothetical protein ABW110_05655 [Steroidobacteraceae bacterium]
MAAIVDAMSMATTCMLHVVRIAIRCESTLVTRSVKEFDTTHDEA